MARDTAFAEIDLLIKEVEDKLGNIIAPISMIAEEYEKNKSFKGEYNKYVKLYRNKFPIIARTLKFEARKLMNKYADDKVIFNFINSVHNIIQKMQDKYDKIDWMIIDEDPDKVVDPDAVSELSSFYKKLIKSIRKMFYTLRSKYTA